MNNKKGISLIVLIVTIIVIIILAAAVILTLNQNNPIDSSRVAQLADNRANINSAIQLYYGKHMAATQGKYDAKCHSPPLGEGFKFTLHKLFLLLIVLNVHAVNRYISRYERYIILVYYYL